MKAGDVMFFRSIVGKLWISFIVFAVIILLFLGLVFSELFAGFYYELKSEKLVDDGTRLAEILAEYPISNPMVGRQVEFMASFVDANITIIDPEGMVRMCSGSGYMGRSAHRGMTGMMMMQHGVRLNTDEVNEVLKGNVVVKRGYHQDFETTLLTAAVPIIRDGEIAGAVLLYAPMEPISETIKTVRLLILYAGGGAIVVATVLSLVLSRKITRPLLKMNRIALDMARGDFTGQVPEDSRDEIGALARSLNYLSQELKKKTAAEKRIEQRRRQFVANVSHELRTPLSYLQGYTEALKDDLPKTEEERSNYLSIIHDETLRLRRLVDDLLDLHRIEEGKLVLERGPVAMDELIKVVVSKLEPRARENGIKLEAIVPEGLPLVAGDADRLEQVLINLVSNALQYTGSGDVVRIEVKDRAGRLQVKVSDTGEGIPEDELPYIWERFYKVDKARTRKGGGTGLGLAIVKGIIAAHGGEISVESMLGKGTTFTFILPVAGPMGAGG